MARQNDFKIVLENGEVFEGKSFGANLTKVCEIVFNTSMVGYQEIITDPAYAYQGVVMTYPVIGNYGITDEIYDSKPSLLGGLIVRDYNDIPSNFRSVKTLSELLEDNLIPAIYGVDTRKLTRIIREEGTVKAIFAPIDTPNDECVSIVKSTILPECPVKSVSCRKKWYSRTSHPKFEVAIIDCGVKNELIKGFNSLGCNVTVLPYNVSKEELNNCHADGIVISNGPGNPETVKETIDLVKELKGKYPIMGVSLGCQIVALAYGAETYKLKQAHHGANHPVRNVNTNKIEIVSQEHSYAIKEKSLSKVSLELTHVNVLDKTVEGFTCKKDGVICVQYSPAQVDVDDVNYIYSDFIKLMEERKNG